MVQESRFIPNASGGMLHITRTESSDLWAVVLPCSFELFFSMHECIMMPARDTGLPEFPQGDMGWCSSPWPACRLQNASQSLSSLHRPGFFDDGSEVSPADQFHNEKVSPLVLTGIMSRQKTNRCNNGRHPQFEPNAQSVSSCNSVLIRRTAFSGRRLSPRILVCDIV